MGDALWERNSIHRGWRGNQDMGRREWSSAIMSLRWTIICLDSRYWTVSNVGESLEEGMEHQGLYAVHNDYRGHTGGVISVGEGIICTKSSKQKLNAKSSTESEIIGASDFISWTLQQKEYE